MRVLSFILRGARLVRDDTGVGWNENEHPRDPSGQFTYGTGSAMKAKFGEHGFHKTVVKTKHGTQVVYKAPGLGLSVNIHPPQGSSKQSSKYTMYQKGNPAAIASGEGSQSFHYNLTQHLKGGGAMPKPAAPTAPAPSSAPVSPPPTPMSPPTATTATPGATPLQETLKTFAESKGYALVDTAASNFPGQSVHVYKNQAGGELQIDPVGNWISKAQGKMDKFGNSPESLQALLEGKPGAYYNYKPVKIQTAPSPEGGGSASGIGETGEIYSATKVYTKLKSHAPTPHDDEHEALKGYTGNQYRTINDCLRHNDNCGNSNVPKIKKYLDRAKIPEDITVYRGVGGDYAKILKSIVTVGTVFRDKGFISTSVHSSVSQSFGGGAILMEISVKAGAKGAPISHLGSHGGEKEILFQAGSKLKVVSYDGKRMKCELVQDDV